MFRREVKANHFYKALEFFLDIVFDHEDIFEIIRAEYQAL